MTRVLQPLREECCFRGIDAPRNSDKIYVPIASLKSTATHFESVLVANLVLLLVM